MFRTLILSGLLVLSFSFIQVSTYAATNLELNPNLDYSSDSNDGQLITGDDMANGMVNPGKPASIGTTSHMSP